MQNIFDAIYNTISGSAFSTSIGGRFSFHEAPQKETFPYAVYNHISTIPEVASGGYLLEDVLIQITLFSNKNSATEVCDIYDDCIALYDEASLTITGYTNLRMSRESSTMIRDPEDNVWQFNIDYRIWAEKT